MIKTKTVCLLGSVRIVFRIMKPEPQKRGSLGYFISCKSMLCHRSSGLALLRTEADVSDVPDPGPYVSESP